MVAVVNSIQNHIGDLIHFDFKKKKILLIENHDSLGIIENNILRDEYDIVRAHSGLEGIDFADRFVPDLIIVDSSIHDINGYNLARLIKNSHYFNKTKLMLLETPDIYYHQNMDYFDSIVSKGFRNKNLDRKIFRNQVKELLFF